MEPHRERHEDGGCDGEQLTLGHVLDEARRERADDDECHQGVRQRRGDERTDAGVVLPSAQHLPGEDPERDEGDGDGDQRYRARLPRQRLRDVAE